MTTIEEDVAAVGRIGAVPGILEVVCRTTGMGFAAVARVTEDRWIACAVRDEIAFGLAPGGELRVETTICDEIRDSREPVIIDEVATRSGLLRAPDAGDVRFPELHLDADRSRRQDLLRHALRHRSQPRESQPQEVVEMFRLFAELIAFHLDAEQRLAASEAAFLSERERAELGEQFVAVLGHDLRTPLASIAAGARLLRKRDVREHDVLRLIDRSVDRMAVLIDNILDLARGRLKGGLALNRRTDDLTPALQHVIDELSAGWPDRRIEARLALDAPVTADIPRLSRLLSNLVSNALTHGAPDQPVRVDAKTEAGVLTLVVANFGEPIPPDVAARLFEPYFRGAASEQGLGLGLHIASAIAQAHGGTLSVESTPAETRFMLRMPL